MATKAELEKKVKTLTDEVRTLRADAKGSATTLEGLTDVAHAIVVDNNKFSLVTIKFNLEGNEAVVDTVKELGSSLAVATTSVKNSVIDQLIKITQGR